MTIRVLWALGMRKEQLRMTVWTLVVVIGFSSLTMLIYIGGPKGILPNLIPHAWMESQSTGFDRSGDGTAIWFLGFSPLGAGAPLLVALALSSRFESVTPPRWLVNAAAVCAVLAPAFAGRRAILGVVVAAPALLLLSRLVLGGFPLPGVLRHRATPPMLATALGAVVLVPRLPASITGTLTSLGRDVLASFFGTGDGQKLADPENRTRAELGQEVLNGWSLHPFLGVDAELPSGYLRSMDRPWMYELQYHLWLHNGGVLGMLRTLAAGLLFLLALRTAARSVSPGCRPLLASAVTAEVCLLIANASNPDLQAVRHWWGVALVFAFTVAVLQDHAVAVDVVRDDRAQIGPVQARPAPTCPGHQAGDRR